MKVGHSIANNSQSTPPSAAPNAESAASKGVSRPTAAHEMKKTEKADKPDRAEKSDEASKSFSNSAANAEISSKSKDFAQAKAVAAKAPDIREDKVADLKSKISEGGYRIDADALADRMVDDHLRHPGVG